MNAHYAQWGKGAIHVRVVGQATTVCGRDMPDEVRAVVYKPRVCKKCQKADSAAVATAEAERIGRFTNAQERLALRRGRQRRGYFTVVRCKACGIQLSQGGNFCMLAGHVADPEEIEVRGPAWVPLHDLECASNPNNEGTT